jgi:hypothetical protein
MPAMLVLALPSLAGQLIEEMDRLGYRLSDAAASMTKQSRPRDSGVFLRRGAAPAPGERT